MTSNGRALCGAIASAVAVALLAGCGADAPSLDATSPFPDSPFPDSPFPDSPFPDSPFPASTSTAAVTVTRTTPAPVPAAPRMEKWIDLDVGDCLADLPSIDTGVVTVTVVDCATSHAAEVYSRVPVAVNSAVADIADHECALGFSRYTGGAVEVSRYAITYLIDSNQDRTSDNPQPSTVICLLQAADGQPLGESARR